MFQELLDVVAREINASGSWGVLPDVGICEVECGFEYWYEYGVVYCIVPDMSGIDWLSVGVPVSLHVAISGVACGDGVGEKRSRGFEQESSSSILSINQ